MGSTDKFLPGTVLSVVAFAAATVPAIELVEVAELEAADDVPPCFKGFPLTPTDEAEDGEVWTEDEEVGTDEVDVDVEVGTVDEEVESGAEEVVMADEEVCTDDET